MDSCARYGCDRPECLEAQRKAARERYRDLKDGGSRVSAEEASDYAAKLVNSGMSAIDISVRSGISATQVRGLLRGGCGNILRMTAQAVLGVPMPDRDRLPEAEGYTDSTGATRRLQALSVQGFPLPPMAEGTGLTNRTVSLIRAGSRERIKVSGLRRIVLLHDRLWDEDPLKLGITASAVTRARQWAAEQKWHPTEAWTDIDDPECIPQKTAPRYVSLTEDARELMEEYGHTRKAAAERLGVKSDTLTAAMHYYDKRVKSA